MRLILASASPRRAKMLRDAGIAFEICATEIDETARPGESAQKMVARLAETKARAAAAQIAGDRLDCIVAGADTAVELDGKILGKPQDAEDARKMLAALGGRTHHVLTGIFLLSIPDGASRAAVETSAVTFDAISREQIDSYVASGESVDKAGAYAIQGIAGRFIPRIEGCYFNVVGLPLARLYKLLLELGWRDCAGQKAK